MERHPNKQYMLVHWDFSTISMVELTPETMRAYQILFAPHQLWRVEYKNEGRALIPDRSDGSEIEAPRVEIISHRTRQLMLERGFNPTAVSNDNALLYNEDDAMQATL